MDKMKHAFIPMSYAEFEQRFLSSVICKNGRLPETDKNTFVGKYSGGQFFIALYGSEFLMKVVVIPCSCGIILKYRFKIRPLIWGVLAMLFVVTLLFFTVTKFDMISIIFIGIRYLIVLGVLILYQQYAIEAVIR